ncbi:FAD-dependent oxidoreductase [Streptomyces cahuitamycinicus]|uniref:FAD-dependent oxidoreductase n=1 Tax=Streptomyces cahuitamycinicus TaxID=2070367 RepID=UPI001FE692D2|nr:hypothetical protein [Streptomyces cahuitamycinicus]
MRTGGIVRGSEKGSTGAAAVPAGAAFTAAAPWPAAVSVRIEDAMDLAACLADAPAGAIADRLARYESLRIPRTAEVQRGSRGNAGILHLPNGPAQRRRDAQGRCTRPCATARRSTRTRRAAAWSRLDPPPVCGSPTTAEIIPHADSQDWNGAAGPDIQGGI